MLRSLLRAAGLLAALSSGALAQWDKVELYVSQKPATSRGDIFWTTICDPAYPERACPLTNPPGLLPGQWNVISVADMGVPATAAQIFVSGVLLISHVNGGGFAPIDMSLIVNSKGYVKSNGWEIEAQGLSEGKRYINRLYNETANLKVGLRAFGDSTPIENNPTDGVFRQWYLGHSVEVDTGQRSNFSSWVPVKDGKIEIKFECTDGHTGLTALSSCAVNLSVQAWGAAVN